MPFDFKSQSQRDFSKEIFMRLIRMPASGSVEFASNFYVHYNYAIHNDSIKLLEFSKKFTEDGLFRIGIMDMIWGHRIDKYLMKYDKSSGVFTKQEKLP